MKPTLIAVLAAAQIATTAEPAFAASIEDQGASQQRTGTFAGARFRVPIGGSRAGKPSMGLGVAGMTESRSSSGEMRMRISEGVQFGYSGERKLGLMVAGKPLKARPAAAEGEEKDDDGDGISTMGWVGIAAGTVVVVGGVGLLLLIDAMNDASE